MKEEKKREERVFQIGCNSLEDHKIHLLGYNQHLRVVVWKFTFSSICLYVPTRNMQCFSLWWYNTPRLPCRAISYGSRSGRMVVGAPLLYNSHHASAPHSSDSRTLLSTWFLQGKKQILKGNPEVRSLLSSQAHLLPGLWFPSFKLITPPGSNSRSRPGWWDYLKQLLAGGEPGHRSWSHWGGSHNPGWAWVGRQVSSAAGSPKPRCLMSGSPTGLQVCSGSAQLAHRVLLKAEAAGSVIRNSQIKAVQGQECRWTSGWAPGELKSNLCSALFISLLRLLWQMTTSFVA